MKSGIALLPDPATRHKVIQIQQECSRLTPLTPALSETGNLPHVTLVQGDVSSEVDWEECLDGLSVVYGAHRTECAPKIIGMEHVPLGWLFIMLQQSELLTVLHSRAFRCVERYMIPPANKRDVPEHYSTLERENFVRYGYRYLGRAFKPHITLGRSGDFTRIDALRDKCAVLVRKYELETLGFEQLTVYRMGANGAHAELLWARRLS